MAMEPLSLVIMDLMSNGVFTTKINEEIFTKKSHLRCRYYDTLLIAVSELFSILCNVKLLTVNSMEGLRSNHNDSRGLMNINDFGESMPFAAFIFSIPLAPGWLVSGKRK